MQWRPIAPCENCQQFGDQMGRHVISGLDGKSTAPLTQKLGTATVAGGAVPVVVNGTSYHSGANSDKAGGAVPVVFEGTSCHSGRISERDKSSKPQWTKILAPAHGPVPAEDIVIDGNACRNTDGSLFRLARAALGGKGTQIGFASMGSPNMQYGFAGRQDEVSAYEVTSDKSL